MDSTGEHELGWTVINYKVITENRKISSWIVCFGGWRWCLFLLPAAAARRYSSWSTTRIHSWLADGAKVPLCPWAGGALGSWTGSHASEVQSGVMEEFFRDRGAEDPHDSGHLSNTQTCGTQASARSFTPSCHLLMLTWHSHKQMELHN